jgi:hypothetical protein
MPENSMVSMPGTVDHGNPISARFISSGLDLNDDRFMSFMVMGVFLVGTVRNITGEVASEPDEKPLIYDPRGKCCWPRRRRESISGARLL